MAQLPRQLRYEYIVINTAVYVQYIYIYMQIFLMY
jgi:hypothetical protein